MAMSPTGSARSVAELQIHKDYQDVVSSIKKQTMEQGRLAVTCDLPAFIVELDGIKASGHVTDSIESVTIETIEKEASIFKGYCVRLIDLFGRIRVWIQLLIPCMEDGNNSGVEVQMQVLAEISRVEDLVMQMLPNYSSYLQTRAKLIGKQLKHSTFAEAVQSYVRAVDALDEQQMRVIKLSYFDLVNAALVVGDLLEKNKAKILAPRSVNGAPQMMY